MDAIKLEEQQLQEQLSTLRLEAEKKRRVLFLILCGVLGSLFVVAACVSMRPQELSPMEFYGILPVALFLLFGAAMIVAGWFLEAIENRAHEVEWEIRNLHEVDG